MNQNDQCSCSEVPGTLPCAERNWKKHSGLDGGCEGNGACVSFRMNDPDARTESADAFRADPANVLRYMGHCKRQKELEEKSRAKARLENLGSTGKGLGHLADEHAKGRSPIPLRELRMKTIAT